MTLVLSLLDACYVPLCKLIHVKEGAAVQIPLAMASRGRGSRFPVAGIFPVFSLDTELPRPCFMADRLMFLLAVLALVNSGCLNNCRNFGLMSSMSSIVRDVDSPGFSQE